MQSDQGTLKIYSDRTYTRTTMVRHQGTALAFAVDDRRRIVYTVLDLSTHDEERGNWTPRTGRRALRRSPSPLSW